MNHDLISADGHVNEPPDLWSKDAPSDLAALVPYVTYDETLGDRWVLAPNLPPRGLGSGRATVADHTDTYRPMATYKKLRPGSYDAAARIEDMDVDGVRAEVLYPGQGRALDTFANADVRLFCARAYNDWMAAFQATDPNRLVGLAILPPLDDGDHAIRELERAADLGLRGAFLSLAMDGRALSDERNEAFWATAAERRIPISLHIGNSRQHWIFGRTDLAAGERESAMAMIGMSIGEELGVFIFSGLLNRHRDLRIVLAESGIGWIAYYLQRMDSVAHKHGRTITSLSDRLPSEVFREQVFATFQEDVAGLRVHDLIGERSIMWASDYPHSETTWPESRAVVEREFGEVPEAARRRILSENCSELYGLSVLAPS